MIMLRSCSYLQPWQQGPAVCPIQLCTNDTISEGVNHTAQTVCCLDTCWCPSQCPDRQLRFLVHKRCSDEMMVGIMISGDTLDLVLPLWKMSELIFVWNTMACKFSGSNVLWNPSEGRVISERTSVETFLTISVLFTWKRKLTNG